MTLTEKQIKKIADDYLAKKIEEDPEFCDNVTDSWIYDAEDWFWHTYKLPDWDEPEDKPEEMIIFRSYMLKHFNEVYKQRYGARDAKEYLPTFIFELQVLSERFRTDIKPYLKQVGQMDDIELKLNELVKSLKDLKEKEK